MKRFEKKKNTTEVINPCIWTEKVASQTPLAPPIVKVTLNALTWSQYFREQPHWVLPNIATSFPGFFSAEERMGGENPGNEVANMDIRRAQMDGLWS